MWTRHPIATACALTVALTVLMTWPQAVHLTDAFAAHQDAYFSAWRLAWIAHALRTDPRHLFDANIFYPAQRTLAYSDATLLEGLLAAPLLWVGVPVTAVYNVLLLGGIAASGLGMFVLARYLTDSPGAALVAAAIFTVAPYRIEHIMHLELQWTVWIPLAFWAIHRTITEQSWRWGVIAGVFLWLQALSCVYYGVFLGLTVAALAVLLLAACPHNARLALPRLFVAACVAGVLAYPYARPYLANAHALGGRSTTEIAQYSARAINYLAAPPRNRLWGWTAGPFGGVETLLFPGASAIVLAALAFVDRRRRLVWIYAALAAVAFELSLGFNAPPYRTLYRWVGALHGLRAPARFGIVTVAAVAVLAAFGFSWVEQRAGAAHQPVGWVAAIVLVLVALEGSSTPLPLVHVPAVPDVYRVLDDLPSGVVLELPLPAPDRLPGRDPIYAFWSAAHWKPLLNGYSGYYPPAYIEMLHRMRAFPDGPTLAYLEQRGVRYLVVHHAYFDDNGSGRLLARMAARPELAFGGTFRDELGDATLFELR